MREIVPSNRLVTHTAPSPAAMPAGPFPTSIGSPTTVFVWGLIRETDFPPLFTTHTASNPTAIPVGFSPTGIESRTSCSSASIRVTVPTSGLVTHTASAEDATDPGPSSSSTVAVTSPDSGSRTPTEFGSISELPPALRATKGMATNAATTANATTAATAFHRVRGGRAIDRTNGAIARASSRSSERTATTWTGLSSPFSSAWPRSVNRTPSTRRARWTISRLASTSPARASEQSRAATFSAPPR